MPHTTLNPAAAFADEGYEGVPFPRPPKEFTRPSFLPDSDDGGTDPGQALRNDGLNPPRPPTLGGRMRESGIQAAEAIVAGGAAGAAAAVRSVSENQTMLALRLAGQDPSHPQAPTGPGPTTGRSACAANHRPALGSGAPAAEGGAAGGGGGARGGAGHRELRFAAARGSGSIGGLRHCCRGSGGSSGSGNRGRGWYGSLGAGGRGSPGCGGHRGCGDVAVAAAGAALVGTAWAIEGGLNAASHLMGWGAATGGGTDSDASRPSMTTDVQTLNGMQESGGVDHYFIQEQRRAQRSQPEVFRIEPRNRPLPQIRSRAARRPRPQAQTPFGLNNVPIPVSSGSERSRVSRQSRGDRGPLGTQPSFEALRQASEPEAA